MSIRTPTPMSTPAVYICGSGDKCGFKCLFCLKPYPTNRPDWMAMVNELHEPTGCGKKLGIFTLSVLNHYVVRSFHKYASSSGKSHLLSSDMSQCDELYQTLQEVNHNLMADLEFIVKKISNGNVDPCWYISSSFISLMALLSINVSQSGLGYPLPDFRERNNGGNMYSNVIPDTTNVTAVGRSLPNAMDGGDPVGHSIFPRVDSRNKLNEEAAAGGNTLTPLSSAFSQKKLEAPKEKEREKEREAPGPGTGERGAMMSIMNSYRVERRDSFNSAATSNPASEYEAEGTVTGGASSPLYVSVIPDSKTPLFQENIGNSNHSHKDRNPSPPINPSPSSGDLSAMNSRAARDKASFVVNEDYETNNVSRGFGFDQTDDDATANDDATAKTFKSENESDDEEEWDEDDDSDEDYWGFGSDDGTDNIDDLGVDMSNMSPNLLASLGIHVENKVETDWTPPAHTGLSNSKPIV